MPYCEIAGELPHLRLAMDTALWIQVMDELEARRWHKAREAEEMRARVEGFRSAKHALDSLSHAPSTEAAPVYLRIFNPPSL